MRIAYTTRAGTAGGSARLRRPAMTGRVCAPAAGLAEGDYGRGESFLPRRLVRRSGADGWAGPRSGSTRKYGGRGGQQCSKAHLYRRAALREGARAVPHGSTRSGDDNAVRQASAEVASHAKIAAGRGLHSPSVSSRPPEPTLAFDPLADDPQRGDGGEVRDRRAEDGEAPDPGRRLRVASPLPTEPPAPRHRGLEINHRADTAPGFSGRRADDCGRRGKRPRAYSWLVRVPRVRPRRRGKKQGWHADHLIS